jgi:predicted lipid-binding transport protein (Tim44 family)
MHADIIIFAVIAAFLIYRLHSVLGTKQGDERSRPNPFAPANPVRGVQGRPSLAAPAVLAAPSPRVAPPLSGMEQYIDPASNQDGRIATGLEEIAAADSTFEINGFMQGARHAFEMIVTAYNKGDISALKSLLSPKLFNDFASGIKAREEAGRTTETIIHRIKSALLIEAHLGGTMGYVTIDFNVEETVSTRDRTGTVVEGNPDRIIEIEDIWTFTRDIRSSDPNWILIETRAVDK